MRHAQQNVLILTSPCVEDAASQLERWGWMELVIFTHTRILAVRSDL